MVPRPRNGLSLCAGGGGLDLGLMLAEPGFHTRCFVEWEEYPRATIIAAQRAGYFAPAPIWDDLTTFDAKPFAGAIDTLLAGYPCQPFSQAGKRLGADDPRHLWPHVSRIIRELGDGLRWVFLENVAGHITLGAETVLRELWEMGWTPAAGAFSAAETGAPHERLRWFCVAHRNANADARRLVAGRSGCGSGQGAQEGEQRERVWLGARGRSFVVAHRDDTRPQGQQRGQRDAGERQVPDGHAGFPGRAGLFPPGPADMGRWSGVIADAPHLAPATSFGDLASYASQIAAMAQAGLVAEAQAEPALRRMADGMAIRTRTLRLLGNGVCPLAAANAWRALIAAHGLWPVDLEAAD